jgi:arginase
VERRQFLMSTGAAIATQLLAGRVMFGREATAEVAERSFHVFGIPLRSGSLVPGNENDAQAYRDVHLLARLQAVGCKAVDDGDVAIPSYLPHHSIPPIRSWPGPRIVWDYVSEGITPVLQQPGQIPLLIGCDCSVVVGTTQALLRASSQEVHVLYIDGDFDDSPPDARRSQSAASCAVWLLTNSSPFWAGPALRPSQVSVIGWTNASRSGQAGIDSVSLADIRRSKPREVAQQVLQSVPASASLLVHFDIDVLPSREMPAAYFPHLEGMTLPEVGELLGILLKDPRVRIIEISEYASLRDFDQVSVGKLVDVLCEALKR